AQAQADGMLANRTAEADARKLAAEALRAEQQAEADGLKAKLEAEATGKRQIADSLNAFSEQAVRMEILPAVLQALVEATGKSAEQLGNIDKISIIGGSSEAKSSLSGLLGISPQTIAGVISTLEDSGIDVTGLVNGRGGAKSEAVVAKEIITTNNVDPEVEPA
ncbi:MAG: flotillin domain-containing protein, partial [Gordonia amarae]